MIILPAKLVMRELFVKGAISKENLIMGKNMVDMETFNAKNARMNTME